MCNANYQKLCILNDCEKCYNRSFASNHYAIFWSNKNELTPRQCHNNSNKRFYFDCDKCCHELYIPLNRISGFHKSFCRYCDTDICSNENCEFCFKKSFASHPMATAWSLKNDFSPREICLGSEKKCWFDCPDCNHSFERCLYSINIEKVCPFCANQRLCDLDCKVCFDKSLASLNLGEKWSSKNKETPRQVFKGSSKKYIFNCLKCSHEIITLPYSYYRKDKITCCYCSNKMLCILDSCITCFNKTFASHPHAVKCWSSKNIFHPREIFLGTEKKIIFNCDRCNGEFKRTGYEVNSKNWCPLCKNKTELKLYNFLVENNINCKREQCYEWCKNENGIKLRYDFVIEDIKIIIELDGIQHFKQVSNWGIYDNFHIRDIDKMIKAITNGYTMIRILQMDVWADKYDWKTELKNEIYQRDTPQYVFLEKGDLYKKHKEAIINM